MSAELFETYIEDILHLVAQNLLIPAIIILLALIVFSLWCIGSIIVEACTERRHLNVAMPDLVDAIDAAELDDLDDLVEESGLLRRQKVCLHEIMKHTQLPEDSLIALAKRLLADEQTYYDRKTGRTDIATKVAPMFGLMGTLIPLGPGIVALGQNNVDTLSSSMLIAFDTTVAGLLAAAVTYIVSRIRKGWYEDYMVTLESIMTCMLDKILKSREGDAGSSVIAGTDPKLGIGAAESVRQSAAKPRTSEKDGGGDDGETADGSGSSKGGKSGKDPGFEHSDAEPSAEDGGAGGGGSPDSGTEPEGSGPEDDPEPQGGSRKSRRAARTAEAGE